MSIRKGNTIIAGNIDAVYETDEQTITVNQDEKLQVIGTINKNTLTPKYDWVGTKAEYDALEEKNEDWLYFVTDDEKETVTLVNCVGQIIQAVCTSNYIPNGCIPCDGTEYTADRFLNFWINYLTSQPAKILTCTYNEYVTEITTYGQCAKFAVDTSANKFKAPTIKDGSVIQQAMSNSELGKAYNAGLPNITGYIQVGNHSLNVGMSAGAADSALYSPGTKKGASTAGDSGSEWPGDIAFDASRSSSIYGNSSTVQPNAVALRYFVVVVDTYLNQSQLDWTTYTQSLNNKADKNLINTGLITNCITEIPQNIKLELNEGILTLKTGSKVYIPNESNVFDEVTLTSDVSRTETANNEYLVMYRNGSIYICAFSNSYSGTTTPTISGTGYWYDTANNIIKRTGDSGSTWTQGYSLPIAKITVSNSAITSIDQVFEGFGYIGSTVFVLPNVKGLIPNGKNADGTLKNLELKTSKVITNTFSSASTAHIYTLFIQEDNSFSKRDDAWKYNESENYNYHSNDRYTDGFIGFNFSAAADGKITSITQKSIFRIIDYSEADFVVSYKRPTSADPSWYRLYKSGWVEQGGKQSASSNTINYPIKMADDTYTLIISATSSGTGETRHSMPITSGRTTSSVTVYIGQYNSAGATSSAYIHNWEVKGFAAGY